jgi:hypothetical protein
MGYIDQMNSAVRDNKGLSRFEIDINGVTAFANYKLIPKRLWRRVDKASLLNLSPAHSISPVSAASK